jgi:hypothetical protein
MLARAHRDLSSYYTNRINEDTRRALGHWTGNSSLYENKLGVQVRGHEAHHPPVYSRVHTNIADKGRGIEMVSAPA